MSGRIGILVPFASNEDADFFQSLEMHMRQEHTFLERVYFVLRVDSYSIDRKLNLWKTGRDHLAFRGYYYPQKSVVDGDLCEAFSLLGQDQQKGIAEVNLFHFFLI
jgi:splicing factor 3B subunit 3